MELNMTLETIHLIIIIKRVNNIVIFIVINDIQIYKKDNIIIKYTFVNNKVYKNIRRKTNNYI